MMSPLVVFNGFENDFASSRNLKLLEADSEPAGSHFEGVLASSEPVGSHFGGVLASSLEEELTPESPAITEDPHITC